MTTSDIIALVGIIQMPISICAIVIWYKGKIKQSRKSFFEGRTTPEWKEPRILRGDNRDE